MHNTALLIGPVLGCLPGCHAELVSPSFLESRGNLPLVHTLAFQDSFGFFLFLAFKELRIFVNFCNWHQFFIECSVSQVHLFSTGPVLKVLQFKCHLFKEYGNGSHEAKLYVVHDDEIPSSFGIHSGFQLCNIGAITVPFIMTVSSVLFQLHQ